MGMDLEELAMLRQEIDEYRAGKAEEWKTVTVNPARRIL
jgi:hypothetical protein